jgi:hypothetical protein
MSYRVGRHEPAIEVDAFDLRIRGQHFQRASHRFDRGSVVSRAHDNPRGGRETLGNASDERALAAICDRGRIQNEGAKSPALPCGEVE